MVVDVQQQQQQQQQQHTTPPATHIDTLFAAVVVAFPVVLKYASGFNKIADSAQVLLPADAAATATATATTPTCCRLPLLLLLRYHVDITRSVNLLD